MIWDFLHILGMRLLVWSGVSLGLGTWLWFNPALFWKGVGTQAWLWGAIDAVIAGSILARSVRYLRRPLNLAEANREAIKTRQILKINAGLDLLYLVVGAVLMWRAEGNALMVGHGAGIILQGAFLLGFDLLHLLQVPNEYVLPDFHLFDSEIHQPFLWEGSGRGAALLVHGFPGSPAEVRDLAKALHDQGWSVQAVCLPGHGREIHRLFQSRAIEWVEHVQRALTQLKESHFPVLLIGYSLGSGISTVVASREPPDGLVLIAPFWIDEPPALRIAVGIARLFLPFRINPSLDRRMAFPELKMAIDDLLPALDLNSAEFQRELQALRVPLIFIEQFRWLSQWVRHSAPQIRSRILVIQAVEDPIVRRASTQRLIKMLGTQVEYLEVPGGHDINRRSHPGHTQVRAAIVRFAETISKISGAFERIPARVDRGIP